MVNTFRLNLPVTEETVGIGGSVGKVTDTTRGGVVEGGKHGGGAPGVCGAPGCEQDGGETGGEIGGETGPGAHGGWDPGEQGGRVGGGVVGLQGGDPGGSDPGIGVQGGRVVFWG